MNGQHVFNKISVWLMWSIGFHCFNESSAVCHGRKQRGAATPCCMCDRQQSLVVIDWERSQIFPGTILDPTQLIANGCHLLITIVNNGGYPLLTIDCIDLKTTDCFNFFPWLRQHHSHGHWSALACLKYNMHPKVLSIDTHKYRI